MNTKTHNPSIEGMRLKPWLILKSIKYLLKKRSLFFMTNSASSSLIIIIRLMKIVFLMLGSSSGAKLLIVCHCEREDGDIVRIISARMATKRESAFYPGGQP